MVSVRAAGMCMTANFGGYINFRMCLIYVTVKLLYSEHFWCHNRVALTGRQGGQEGQNQWYKYWDMPFREVVLLHYGEVVVKRGVNSHSKSLSWSFFDSYDIKH